jgi:hypothetical protein
MFKAAAPWTFLIVFGAISLAAVLSVLAMVVGAGEPFWGCAGASQLDPALNSVTKQLRGRLNQRINLDKGIDGNTPLKDALEFLADRYDLTLIIDTTAFEQIGVQRVEETPVTLPKMTRVRLSTVLRMLLAQVKGDVHSGTYVIEKDYVCITTTGRTFRGESLPADERLGIAVVDTCIDQTPLSAALREIADDAGINLLLDARVAETARKPVSAAFTQVPADTAVRLLADMCGLRAVAVDNVLYVTTVDNAKEIEAEQKARPVVRPERVYPQTNASGEPDPAEKKREP